jgi:membrane protein YdbS with pleckstrin-like domain
MDSIAVFLAILIVVLLGVIIYVMLNPQYQPYPVMPHRIRPHPVMPQFGPYWSHGGQTNTGLLY